MKFFSNKSVPPSIQFVYAELLHNHCRFADLINEDTLEAKIYELIKHQKLHYALAVIETDIEKEVRKEIYTYIADIILLPVNSMCARIMLI